MSQVLVAQQDPAVSRRIEEELAKARLRVAGPVADLDRALARTVNQVVTAALVDLLLAPGTEAIARFRSERPSLPVIATAPRRFESRARKALAEGAHFYLLHEEVGRGFLGPVIAHLTRAQGGVGPEDPGMAAARRQLHDLGNMLAVASGESEMLLSKVAPGDPLADDVRGLHAAISESANLFREYAARRTQGAK